MCVWFGDGPLVFPDSVDFVSDVVMSDVCHLGSVEVSGCVLAGTRHDVSVILVAPVRTCCIHVDGTGLRTMNSALCMLTVGSVLDMN